MNDYTDNGYLSKSCSQCRHYRCVQRVPQFWKTYCAVSQVAFPDADDCGFYDPPPIPEINAESGLNLSGIESLRCADMNSQEIPRVLAGCRALQGCSDKENCERYQQYLRSKPGVGFNAYHTCIVTKMHFVKKRQLNRYEPTTRIDLF